MSTATTESKISAPAAAAFPTVRMRRLRSSANMRAMVRENHIRVGKAHLPVVYLSRHCRKKTNKLHARNFPAKHRRSPERN